MSKKIWGNVGTILYRVLLILTVVQVGMGILWILYNFGLVPGFSGTAEMLEISETLVTDEYVGILYPILVKAALFLDGFLPVPYQCFLYLLQLGIGFFAIRNVFGYFPCRHKELLTLWVLTIPTVLQLFLAVLPQALGVSLLLLCTMSCCDRSWARGGLYWLIAGLLVPEYFVFGGIVYVMALLIHVAKRRLEKQALVRGLICFLSVCVLTVGVSSLVQEPYSRGRMERTPLSVALQRVVWPHYYTNNYFWVMGVTELFDQGDLWNLSLNPESPVREFGTLIEQNYDPEYVEYIYRQMVRTTFEVRTKEVILDMANDLAGYTIPPIALLCNLEGKGVSYSGWNYMLLSKSAPILTKYYVRYSCVVFGVFLIGALVGTGKKRRGASRRRLLPCLLLTVCTAQILWYTMSASGMQDYLNVAFVSIAYGIFIMTTLFRDEQKA